MSSTLPSPMALASITDPHRDSRERAERLLAWVDRELREHPSAAFPAVPLAGTHALPFTHGLWA